MERPWERCSENQQEGEKDTGWVPKRAPTAAAHHLGKGWSVNSDPYANYVGMDPNVILYLIMHSDAVG